MDQASESSSDVSFTSSASLREAALDYAGRGLPVFPCRATGGNAKKPHTLHGFKDASTDSAQINNWWTTWPDALIGIPTGEVSGLVVLDVDMDLADGKDGEATLKALLLQLGKDLPQTSIVRTPRGGRHFYFLHPGTKVPSRTDWPGLALDIRGDGGYVIVPPSTSGTGAYAWLDSAIEAAPLPDWLSELMVREKKPRTTATAPQPPPPNNPPPPPPQPSGEVDQIRVALKFIPASDRTVWRDVGFGLKNHFGDGGWEIFDAWSRTAPESYDAEQNRRQWESFKPDGGMTIATVFHLAKQHGWQSERTRYKSDSTTEDYLGGDGAERPAAAEPSTLLDRLAERMYSSAVKPEEPAPRFSLGDVPTCTPGNLTTVSAQAKAGKTAAVSAMIASTLAVPSADCLGFSSCNTLGHAVVHVDTEQCPFDHWDGVERMLRRAKVNIAPPWLRSYWLTGFSALDVRVSVRVLLAAAATEFGGIHSVFIDGIADAVCDVNDPSETSSLITELQKLAIEFDCPVINIIHVNPGSDFKTRGHLGSQLERKSETNLRLEKDGDDVTVIWADKNRRAPIPKATAPRFAWNDRAGMHASVGSLRDAKDEGQKTDLQVEAARLFASAKKSSITYGEFVELIMSVVYVSKSTAKRRVEQMLRTQVVHKDLAGSYSLIK